MRFKVVDVRILVAMIGLLMALAVTPASAEEPRVNTGAVLTLADVRERTQDELSDYLTQATGTDGDVKVDREGLLELLADGGEIIVPVAASGSLEWDDSESFEPHAVSNASINYFPVLGSGPPHYLLVCRDWGATACSSSSPRGWLYRGENSKQKFGWPDTDGYHHPSSNCETRATAFGVITYTFTTPGWVKLSGLGGLTWFVNMNCT